MSPLIQDELHTEHKVYILVVRSLICWICTI